MCVANVLHVKCTNDYATAIIDVAIGQDKIKVKNTKIISQKRYLFIWKYYQCTEKCN
jgi:hypothetical protein